MQSPINATGSHVSPRRSTKLDRWGAGLRSTAAASFLFFLSFLFRFSYFHQFPSVLPDRSVFEVYQHLVVNPLWFWSRYNTQLPKCPITFRHLKFENFLFKALFCHYCLSTLMQTYFYFKYIFTQAWLFLINSSHFFCGWFIPPRPKSSFPHPSILNIHSNEWLSVINISQSTFHHILSTTSVIRCMWT